MKLIIILFVLVTIGASFPQNSNEKDLEWEEYKKTFEKVYDAEEDVLRRAIYYKTKKEIDEHNKKYEAGLESYMKGITQFTDITLYEFSAGKFGYVSEQTTAKIN